jgi:hypothetical protein
VISGVDIFDILGQRISGVADQEGGNIPTSSMATSWWSGMRERVRSRNLSNRSIREAARVFSGPRRDAVDADALRPERGRHIPDRNTRAQP